MSPDARWPIADAIQARGRNERAASYELEKRLGWLDRQLLWLVLRRPVLIAFLSARHRGIALSSMGHELEMQLRNESTPTPTRILDFK